MMNRRNRSALDMMDRCHHKLNQRSEELCQATAALVAQQDVENAMAAAQEVVAFLKRTGRRHIADEEQSLFPRLSDDLADLVKQLSDEHREQEGMIQQLDELLQGAEYEKLQQLSQRLANHYTTHAMLEDGRLLPALKAMSEDDQQQILVEMQARRNGQGQRKRGER